MSLSPGYRPPHVCLMDQSGYEDLCRRWEGAPVGSGERGERGEGAGGIGWGDTGGHRRHRGYRAGTPGATPGRRWRGTLRAEQIGQSDVPAPAPKTTTAVSRRTPPPYLQFICGVDGRAPLHPIQPTPLLPHDPGGVHDRPVTGPDHLHRRRTCTEKAGFEPAVSFNTHDFQSCTFDHSVTSPYAHQPPRLHLASPPLPSPESPQVRPPSANQDTYPPLKTKQRPLVPRHFLRGCPTGHPLCMCRATSGESGIRTHGKR